MADEPTPWAGPPNDWLVLCGHVPLSQEVREYVATLDRDERLTLMYALQWEFENEPISDEVKEELLRCEAEDERNPTPGYSIEEIRAMLRTTPTSPDTP